MGEQKPKDNYLLDRGGLASTRLSLQHYAFKRYQGWLLHPDVRASIPDQKGLRIADLATGNAIWALEIAEEYPDAEVVGTDISDAQYPPRMAWPSNLKLELGNLFEPVPEKYQNYFDVVHVRIIVAAIYNMDKDLLLRNILAMVKPGGYIQWDELIEPTILVVNPDLTIQNKMSEAVRQMYNVSAFRPATQWALTLPKIFTQYGLENVVGHKPEVKPSTLPLQTEALIMSFREILNFAIKNGLPNAEEALKQAEQGMEGELGSGLMWAYAFLITVGRKPVGN